MKGFNILSLNKINDIYKYKTLIFEHTHIHTFEHTHIR